MPLIRFCWSIGPCWLTHHKFRLTMFNWALKGTWQSYYSPLDDKLVYPLQLKFQVFSHLLKFSCLTFPHTLGLQVVLPSCLLKTLIIKTVELKFSLHLLYFISLLSILCLWIKGKSDLLFQLIPTAFCSIDIVCSSCLCCNYFIHVYAFITDFLCIKAMPNTN